MADELRDTMAIPVGDAALARAIGEIDRRFAESTGAQQVRLAAINPIWITLIVRVLIAVIAKWLEHRTAISLHRELQACRGFGPIAWTRRMRRRLQIRAAIPYELESTSLYGDLDAAILETLTYTDAGEFGPLCDAIINTASQLRSVANPTLRRDPE